MGCNLLLPAMVQVKPTCDPDRRYSQREAADTQMLGSHLFIIIQI